MPLLFAYSSGPAGMLGFFPGREKNKPRYNVQERVWQTTSAPRTYDQRAVLAAVPCSLLL